VSVHACPRRSRPLPNGELADSGVYAGTLSITAFISGSEMGELATAAASESSGPLPRVDPDELADRYWEMYVERDRVEQVYPPVTA
jgi:hypothetical protein